MTKTEDWWRRILCGSEAGDLHAASSDEKYVLLPRASDPRVIVDSSNQHAMRETMQRFMENRTGSAAGILSEGASRVFSRRRADWIVASPERTLRQHLSELLGVEVQLTVAVGPPRPNRKPIVRCYEGSELLAVAKLGPDPHTAAMVVNEGEWLEWFGDKPFTEIVTPQVLHRGTFASSELLVTAPFDVDQPSVEIREIPLELVQTIGDRSLTSDPVAQSSWWSELLTRLDFHSLDRWSEVASELSSDERFQSLDSSIWHGDWSPWNMGRLADQRLIIWDWERAADGVPLGLDLLHLHYQYGDGIDGALPELGRLGIPTENHQVLKAAYFLEIVARHHEGGAIGGERYVDVESQLNAVWPVGGGVR